MWWWVLALAEAKRPKPAEPAAEPPPPVEAAPAVAPAPPAAVDAPVPRFEKVEFPGCGCAAYLPKDAGVYPPDSSPDGSLVWKTERAVGSHTFAVITVKLAEPAGDAAAPILEAYLEHLKVTFDIESTAGLGRGHTLEAVPGAKGVIDFWKGKDGTEWAVKAWATPDRLAVFLVYGPGEYPHVGARAMFFDGFRVE